MSFISGTDARAVRGALRRGQADAPVVMIKPAAVQGRGWTRELSALRAGGRPAPSTSRRDRPLTTRLAAPSVVIGDGEKPWWDAIIVVEYPSPAAFLDMGSDEEYLKVHEHRVGPDWIAAT